MGRLRTFHKETFKFVNTLRFLVACVKSLLYLPHFLHFHIYKMHTINFKAQQEKTRYNDLEKVLTFINNKSLAIEKKNRND